MARAAFGLDVGGDDAARRAKKQYQNELEQQMVDKQVRVAARRAYRDRCNAAGSRHHCQLITAAMLLLPSHLQCHRRCL
jgi:hypothetical protein